MKVKYYMKRLCDLFLVLAMCCFLPHAYAIDQTKRALDITTRAFARSVDFTSDTTTSTRDKFKLVHAAKSDAAAYVASDGAIQGVYLTRAVAFIRSEFPAARKLNDLELAKAILSVK